LRFADPCAGCDPVDLIGFFNIISWQVLLCSQLEGEGTPTELKTWRRQLSRDAGTKSTVKIRTGCLVRHRHLRVTSNDWTKKSRAATIAARRQW
jgi:hypothetical protein